MKNRLVRLITQTVSAIWKASAPGILRSNIAILESHQRGSKVCWTQPTSARFFTMGRWVKITIALLAAALLWLLIVERFSSPAKKCFAAGGGSYDFITGDCYEYPPMDLRPKKVPVS
jgi:hypothetical protein